MCCLSGIDGEQTRNYTAVSVDMLILTSCSMGTHLHQRVSRDAFSQCFHYGMCGPLGVSESKSYLGSLGIFIFKYRRHSIKSLPLRGTISHKDIKVAQHFEAPACQLLRTYKTICYMQYSRSVHSLSIICNLKSTVGRSIADIYDQGKYIHRGRI